MFFLDSGITLCSSADGVSFNTVPGVDICKSCGKRTLICPHHIPKDMIMKLPDGCTHLKFSKVDSDMRMTMSAERNTRLSKIRDGVMFTLLETATMLEDIWEEIGIKEEQKLQRNNTVATHIEDLLKEMLAEEEDLKNKMKLRTQEYSKELEQLVVDLGIPPKQGYQSFDCSMISFLNQTRNAEDYQQKVRNWQWQIPSNLSLLQLENRLRGDVDTLNKEKHDRLKTLKRLRTEETLLCERLVLPQHDVNFVGCPTLEQLRELETNVKFLKAEKTKRFELFKKLQVSITHLWTELDVEPKSDIEQQLCVANADEAFVLSTEHLDELTKMQKSLENEHNDLVQQIDTLKEKVSSLWERLETPMAERNTFLKKASPNTPKVAKMFIKELERLQELKRQHMQRFIESLRKELVELWDKCHFGEDQRQLFTSFYSDIYTESTLADHEHQLATMKNYYNDNKELFKLVEKRETLWKKKLEFENRSGDSNRLNNRGGALLKEEKMRKAVEKELPKLECQIRKLIIAWEKDNETYFMMQGNRYVDFIELQRNEYEKDQQVKKDQKLKSKKQEIDKESVFGAKPAKRKNGHEVETLWIVRHKKLVGTPVKNIKVSRMDYTHATPSKFVHSSIMGSPMHRKLPLEKKAKSTQSNAKKGKVVSENRKRSVKRRSIRLKNAAKSKILGDRNVGVINSNDPLKTLKIEKSSASNQRNNLDISLVPYNEFSDGVAECQSNQSSFLCRPTDPSPTLLNYTSISSKSTRSTRSSKTNNTTLFDRTSKVFRI